MKTNATSGAVRNSFTGGVHGQDRAKVCKELCEAVDEVIADGKKGNLPLPEALAAKKFNGKVLLRIDSDLHRLMAIRASAADESLNTFLAKRLQKAG